MELRERKTPAPRKRKNFSESDKKIIEAIDKWVASAMEKEQNGEKIFQSNDHAMETSKICKISRSSIFNVRKDGSEVDWSQTGRQKIILDDFDKSLLSRMILGFYKKNPPELPNLDKIYAEIQSIPSFPKLGRTTLYNTIKSLGFAYKKRDKKMNIYQRFDIVVSRHKFLLEMEKLRAAGYKVFYQDETWCNANHTIEYVWQTDVDDELMERISWKGGLDVPQGQGKRLIINHIGSEDGFLLDCGECFVGVKNTSDYHHEMNGPHFEEWWEKKILPALPNKSVILIDNAKYHSRQTEESKKPTTSWRKAEIQEWLVNKGIAFTAKETIPLLLEKVKALNIIKEYRLEKITKRYCEENQKDIRILRLPVGHSELNAIELIWAQVKTEVAKKNTTFKIADVKNLVEQALDNVSSENWKKAILHTIKVEKSFHKIDFGDKARTVQPVIIDLGESDSESDVSTSDEYE